MPNYRGQGLARTLMNTLHQTALDIGYEKLRLETYTVLVKVRVMYKEMGFEIVETAQQNRFGKDLIQEF